MARRRINVFSLSFLDIMSCGFGAVVLFFMIINHNTKVRSDTANRNYLAEVNMLEEEVRLGRDDLLVIRNAETEAEEERRVTQGKADRIIEEIRKRQQELTEMTETTLAQRQSIEKLQSDLKSLEESTRRLDAGSQEPDDRGENVRAFVGDGDRQYLTGLKVGGERILFLVDNSASMLDETIVNIVRRRNMSTADKMRSPKWRRAVGTVEWLVSQIPPDSKYQIKVFNESARSVLPDSDARWLDASDTDQLEEAVVSLRQAVPAGGTSLHNAFIAAGQMSPRPDNIILLVDSLPTQAENRSSSARVSGKRRLRYYRQSLQKLPANIPVNIILFPMEGDPRAASEYWKLAQVTGGSFMAPSRDWP